MAVTLAIDPPSADVLMLERGLFGYEEARLGNPEHTHFALFLRDAGGQVQGGVDCHVMWHRAFVKTLWLPERLRNKGHGTTLMHGAEEEAVRLGCKSMWLTALGDPARLFYKRLGYYVFGEHKDYVAGHTLFSLRKDF